MEENQNQTYPKESQTETKMTHLMTYQGPRGDEMQLNDAEFRGEHYFDYRRYTQLARGKTPTPKGLRLSRTGVGHLKDAISQWEKYYEKITSQNAPKKEKGNVQNQAGA